MRTLGGGLRYDQRGTVVLDPFERTRHIFEHLLMRHGTMRQDDQRDPDQEAAEGIRGARERE